MNPEVLERFVKEIKSARSISIAEALITSSGLDLVRRDIAAFLQRGGSARVLVGFDLPTDPKAFVAFQKLYPEQCKSSTVPFAAEKHLSSQTHSIQPSSRKRYGNYRFGTSHRQRMRNKSRSECFRY